MSDDKRPKMELVSGTNKVSTLNKGFDEEIQSILDHLQGTKDKEGLMNVMVAYTRADGTSYVLFSPMTGGAAAYLTKQVEVEFMANYMFPDEA